VRPGKHPQDQPHQRGARQHRAADLHYPALEEPPHAPIVFARLLLR
jgi:hypothetical protein